MADAAPTTTAPAPMSQSEFDEFCALWAAASPETRRELAKHLAAMEAPAAASGAPTQRARLCGTCKHDGDSSDSSPCWDCTLPGNPGVMLKWEAAASGESPQLQADTLALMRKFIENIATPKSEPLNTIVVLSLRIERQRAMGKLREQARVLLEAIDAAAAAQAAPAAQPLTPHQLCEIGQQSRAVEGEHILPVTFGWAVMRACAKAWGVTLPEDGGAACATGETA